MTDPIEPRRVLSSSEIDDLMIEMEKGQQLGGHHPSSEALGRARRLLSGEITKEEAYREISEKYYGEDLREAQPE
ncbi:hypothetical protein [Cryobacterium sp. Y29]|uniref:hypothetical protein n=1 Tax=Cryobacterium sp. Y29 TaxID=2048285 RepID=UPI000CE30E02|nr:hypothetical protein [Cryobacterium sp. Y29]